jgi:hypothetical protein
VKALIFHEFSGQRISPSGIMATPGRLAGRAEKKDSGPLLHRVDEENLKFPNQLRAGCR